jgi:hypothetical protein
LGAELAMQTPLLYNPNPAYILSISDNPNDLRLKLNVYPILHKQSRARLRGY